MTLCTETLRSYSVSTSCSRLAASMIGTIGSDWNVRINCSSSAITHFGSVRSAMTKRDEAAMRVTFSSIVRSVGPVKSKRNGV